MKIKSLLLFVMFFSLQTNAQIATSIFSIDSRTTNYLPQDRNSGVYFDFKANTTDGLLDTNTYHGIMTFRPYGVNTDFSGGLAHQLAFTDNGNLWIRSGSNTTWLSWIKIYSDKNINRSDTDFNAKNIFANGNVGIGTTTPAALLDLQKIYGNDVGIKLTQPGSSIWDIKNTASTGLFTIGAGGGTYFNIDKTGSVGIGTTTPAAKLDVNGAIYSNANILSDSFGGFSGGDTELTTNTGGAANLKFKTQLIERMRIIASGNVGIGSTNPDEKLTVKGKIHAEEIKVDLAVPADYVFEKYYTGKSKLKSDYSLQTLAEIESFTKENHHLPNIPSAQEIQQNGLLLGEMSNVLLQKIEELTLYAIEQNKVIEELKAQVSTLMSKKQ
jgi:hypothetical protein